MEYSLPCALTINGGSSSIRFAVYEAGEAPRLLLDGKIDRIGLGGTNLVVNGPSGSPRLKRGLSSATHRTAVAFLLDWLESEPAFASVKTAGHRVVHGMRHSEPERVTTNLLRELHRITAYAPDHLPREIALIEALRRRHRTLPQGGMLRHGISPHHAARCQVAQVILVHGHGIDAVREVRVQTQRGV